METSGEKLHWDSKKGIEGNTFVVTGGLGFVGSALCLELLRRGARQVRAFDVRATSPRLDQLKTRGVLCIQGDVTCKQDVERALHGAQCVFHLASFGASGKEMLQPGRIKEVNVDGTCHVVETCLELGIERLVYQSSYNVVFGGKEIENGDETLPYCRPADVENAYPFAHSKSVAEQLVLKSNNQPFKKNEGKCLYTCAIRPAAVYGPGEERQVSRFVFLAKLGLLLFKIGEPNVLTDWVHVDNLVLALVLASTGLVDDTCGQPVAAGRPFFVSDGCPVNSFEFMRPLLSSLDYGMPKASLSVPHALLLSKFFGAVYSSLHPLLNRRWLPDPPLIPAEVYQVGVTHYFSIQEAKKVLGYSPIVRPEEGMEATISYWRERKSASVEGPTIYAWIFCIVGLPALFSAAFLPDIGPVALFRSICLFLFRSMQNVRIAFFICAATHVGEATYAYHLAKRVDPANRKAWFWQTLVVATFSLHYLWKRAKEVGYKQLHLSS